MARDEQRRHRNITLLANLTAWLEQSDSGNRSVNRMNYALGGTAYLSPEALTDSFHRALHAARK